MIDKKHDPKDQELKALRKKNKELEKELQRKEKALAEAAALLILKKKTRCPYEGGRGRLILEEYKAEVIVLIEDAHDNGARYSKACQVVGMSLRTLQRWKRCGVRDHRKGSVKRIVRKLSEECRREIVGQCNLERFQDLNPYEIVPLLLNEGVLVQRELENSAV